jgi:hypothetical protein
MVTTGHPIGWTLPADRPDACAVERFFEAHLPLPQDEVLLGIECGGERMPSDGLWRLEFLEVDES